MIPAVPHRTTQAQHTAARKKSRRWCCVLLLMLGPIFSGVVNAEELEATVLWANKAPLGTPTSGVVAVVNAGVGDFVKRGSVLMTLDSRSQQADVLAQRAGLKRAENDLAEAGRELQRTQELYDRTLLSNHELEVAVIQRDAAEANLQMTRASLLRAELDLEYATLTAPFDAWVVSREVAVGQTIVSRLQATPLFELAEAGAMLARTAVSAKRLSSLQKGNRVTVNVAGKSYAGQVAHIALEPIKPGATEYAVDVLFDSGKTLLRAGLPAKVSF